MYTQIKFRKLTKIELEMEIECEMEIKSKVLRRDRDLEAEGEGLKRRIWWQVALVATTKGKGIH